MALSAFYIHKRSVDQVLDRFIKLRRRDATDDRSFISESAGEDESYVDGEIDTDRNIWRHGELSKSLDQNAVNYYYRASSSLPNVGLSHEWLHEESNTSRPIRFENQALSTSFDNNLNLIPSGLPQLRTDQRDGMCYFQLLCSSTC